MSKREGEAIGALHHNDIGDIDLVWGKAGTGKSDGFGLAKLAKFHPEVLSNLQEMLDEMIVTSRTKNRVQLESEKHQAAVRLTWDNNKKTWLLTMFEKKNSVLSNTTDTDKTHKGNENDTATLENTVISDSKDKQVSDTKQEKRKEEDVKVDPNPTEAQKEAGNYKKGHLSIDGYRITIENPKGSLRTGKDKNGNKWETEMHNSYGYIRGTESVDGDHIDIFLSDNPTEGNVFVVDQVKEDGSFDEHKVMYGFNSIEEAKEAYLSNYTKGWKGLGSITEVSKEDFKKWIGSSKRKTKPFAEYKSVKDLNLKNSTGESKGYTIEPTQYTTKRGKILDMHFVKFGRELTKEEQQNAEDIAKSLKGWYDRKQGGFMMRSAENAQQIADALNEHSKPIAEDIKKENQYGSQNKIITTERYEELRKRLRDKLNNLNVGFDPEIFAIGAQMAAYHIEAGAVKFRDFANRMINDLGEAVKPYLKSFYEGARQMPGLEDFSKNMDSYDVVKKSDIENKINEQKDSNKKSVSFGTETLGIFDNNELKDKENGLLRNDEEVRSKRLSADSSRHEEELSGSPQSSSTGEEQESRGTDAERKGRSNGQSGALRSGLSDTVENSKNRNNNHSERGVEYAPATVDSRIKANIEAIELANNLIENGEKATPEQMAVLRQFSGWGGLGKIVSDEATARKLQELIGADAYQEAIASSRSSYYTPTFVVDTLWDIAEKLGFKGGNILEGSAGIGNILGQMPMSVSDQSNIHAIEIDSTSGNILSLLYPDAKVEIQGFQDTRIPNGSIDLAITNVPFVTGLRVTDTTGDKDLSKKFHHIHDFCIAKNVRKLREGGIGIFISSNGTLDNSKKLRDWVVNEGGSDFIGAFRLNNKTFVGTPVTSDIIVVRKRVNAQKSPNSIDVSNAIGERTAEYDTGETKRVKGEIVPVVRQLAMDYNRYFVEHPEYMGGEMRFEFEMGETFRPTSKGLYPVKGKNQEELLTNFVNSLKEESLGEIEVDDSKDSYVFDNSADGKKVGEVYVKDDALVVAGVGGYYPLDVNSNKVKGHTKVECFNAYSKIKTALADVLDYQTNNETDRDLKPLLDKLNKAYDDFVKTYGHFNKNTAIAFLKKDVDFPNIFSLEKYEEVLDKNANRVQKFDKTDVFKKRVIEKEKEPIPTNVKDGIIASIFKFGRINIPYIASQLDKNEEDIRKEMLDNGYAFEDPTTRQIEVSFKYLSGNVREKLRQAKENNENGAYNANIKALEELIPIDIPAHLIEFTLGSSWIDPKLYNEYTKERTGLDIKFKSVGGTWFLDTPEFTSNEKNRSMGVTSEMLNKIIMGHALIEAAIQNKTITVSQTSKNYDGTTETIVDKEATQACSAKIEEIRQDFKEWARAKIQSDVDLADQIASAYNEVFNNYVPMNIDEEFVPEYFSGASRKFKMYPHQGKAIVRGTMEPLLLAHEVGTGKTFTLISTAMEMRRLGTARKPMIVVQNATVGQFVSSAKELYPNAKILTLEESDRSAEGRKNFYAKIKYNNWDIIVVPQSTFEFIPDSEERQIQFVKEKIEEKMAVLEKMKEADSNSNSFITRQAEREITQLESELAELSESTSKKSSRDEKSRITTMENAEAKAKEMLDRTTDDVENFDDMGIDALLIDEAHEYKHLGFATAMQRGIKGVDPSYSKKSQGVYLKTQAVLEKNNGRNVVFATGTPISNTAAEIWTFMRYLMPADTMREYGIYYFDDFVRNFGNIQQMLEFTTSGKFKENNRFAGYVNLPELIRIWTRVSDTVLTKESGAVRDKIPQLEGGKAQDIYLPQTRALRSIMKYVKMQLERFEEMSGKEKKENRHIPIVMYGIAKAAAVDARLVQSNAEDDPNSKTNEAVKFLLSKREGEAIGALHHNDIGDIAIVWGNAKAGLQKIANKHPEILYSLQETIEGMNVVHVSDNRIKLESDTHFAVVSRDWMGKKHTPWLLTAYEKKERDQLKIPVDKKYSIFIFAV